MAVVTRHTRFEMSALCTCSKPGCQRMIQPGEIAWVVRGDIEYDALCGECHGKTFSAIDYAVTRTGAKS
jgi:hypothetical protein